MPSGALPRFQLPARSRLTARVARFRLADEAARDVACGVHRARWPGDCAGSPGSAAWVHCNPCHRHRSWRRRRAQHVVRRRHRCRDGSHGQASDPSRQDLAAEALAFGLVLACSAVAVLALALNVKAAALLAFTIFFYVVVYTVWLKRQTPQNIVIGGAAGALPPVIGWAAATGDIGLEPLVLFLIIFLWTPPHFWALSLNRADEYARAGVPMLPVVAGRAATTRQILIYSVLLVCRFRCCRGRSGLPARSMARPPPSAERSSSRSRGSCAGAAGPIGEPLIACLHFPLSICSCCLRRCWPATAAIDGSSMRLARAALADRRIGTS